MDIDKIKKSIVVDSLNLARRIGLYNSESIEHNKNSFELDTLKQKELADKHEKFEIIIKTNFQDTLIELILANPINRSNHNIMLLDVELIQQTLLEGLREEEDEDNEFAN